MVCLTSDSAGVYLLRRASDGASAFAAEPELLSAELPRPNGIALSPDGRQLYVSNSDDGNNRVHVFDIERDASGRARALSNSRLFVNFSAVALQSSDSGSKQAGIAPRDGKLMQGPGTILVVRHSAYVWPRCHALAGNADGLKVDVLGNVWATGPSGVFILAPSGEWLGTISINGAASMNKL
mgnify:CR=1 FL=1